MPSRTGKPARHGLIAEYMYFLRSYRMWWLVPVFAAVTILGVLVVLGGTKAGLLIYALF
jgi:Family of unknown function (DUF5989)